MWGTILSSLYLFSPFNYHRSRHCSDITWFRSETEAHRSLGCEVLELCFEPRQFGFRQCAFSSDPKLPLKASKQHSGDRWHWSVNINVWVVGLAEERDVCVNLILLVQSMMDPRLSYHGSCLDFLFLTVTVLNTRLLFWWTNVIVKQIWKTRKEKNYFIAHLLIKPINELLQSGMKNTWFEEYSLGKCCGFFWLQRLSFTCHLTAQFSPPIFSPLELQEQVHLRCCLVFPGRQQDQSLNCGRETARGHAGLLGCKQILQNWLMLKTCNHLWDKDPTQNLKKMWSLRNVFLRDLWSFVWKQLGWGHVLQTRRIQFDVERNVGRQSQPLVETRITAFDGGGPPPGPPLGCRALEGEPGSASNLQSLRVTVALGLLLGVALVVLKIGRVLLKARLHVC